MTTEEFIATWNSCRNAIEFAAVTGQSVRAACVRASRLRKQGHEVKRMPWKITQSIEDRFWAMVLKTESCWLWQGYMNPKGYGLISTKRGSRPLQTHRVSYEIHYGPIPDGLWVLHKCDNQQCVNPEHLFLGTAHDNTADMIAKERGHWQRNAPSKLLAQAQQELANS